MEDSKMSVDRSEEIEGTEPSEQELRKMETQIRGNMEKVKAGISVNENMLLNSSLSLFKMDELRLKQVELGNTMSWLTQVLHNRVLMPLKKYEPKSRIIPGIGSR